MKTKAFGRLSATMPRSIGKCPIDYTERENPKESGQ